MTAEKEQGRIAYPTLPNPLTNRDLKQLFTPWSDEIEWTFKVVSQIFGRSKKSHSSYYLYAAKA